MIDKKLAKNPEYLLDVIEKMNGHLKDQDEAIEALLLRIERLNAYMNTPWYQKIFGPESWYLRYIKYEIKPY